MAAETLAQWAERQSAARVASSKPQPVTRRALAESQETLAKYQAAVQRQEAARPVRAPVERDVPSTSPALGGGFLYRASFGLLGDRGNPKVSTAPEDSDPRSRKTPRPR